MTSPFEGRRLTRRQLLASFGLAGAALAAGSPAAAAFSRGSKATRLVDVAASTRAAGSDLGAVEHIVFLMMENRSYDHYFGAYPRGRGFDDHPARSLGVFAQDYPGGAALSPPDVLLPFHLNSGGGFECTDDLTHDWGPQHLCWNDGKMDSFVTVHTSSTYEGANGAMTMGYYDRSDLPFYYALADAFTLCDGYHAAILGPTHPNRLMANSGTIDPGGTQGGPVTDTNETPDALWNCTWPTMQEVLQDAGIPWKVYHPSNVGVSGKYAPLTAYPTWNPALYNPTTNPEVMVASDHILPYFTAFRSPLSPLYENAFTPTFPNTFVSDVNSGTMPSVSWIIAPLGFDEHPSSSPDNGMYFTSLVLDALTANPTVWSKTALFLMYDENDGWFDHVPPPTAPPGTPGEYLTASPPSTLEPDHSNEDLGINGPLGLGVRVPCLVISPFSRGGHVATWPRRPSITRRSCSWWRRGSASKCRTSPPGARRRWVTSRQRCSPGAIRPPSPRSRSRLSWPNNSREHVRPPAKTSSPVAPIPVSRPIRSCPLNRAAAPRPAPPPRSPVAVASARSSAPPHRAP